MRRLVIGILTVGLLSGVFHGISMASDLDDGISKYTDDSIAADDELGKPSKNIKFIIRNAKSQAKVAEKNSGKGNSKTGKTTGDNNRNSVVMGAGSNVRGDIIIIDESKN